MIGRDTPDASLCQGDCCGQKEGGTIKHYDFCPPPIFGKSIYQEDGL